MQAVTVSSFVGKFANEGPVCIEPLADPEGGSRAVIGMNRTLRQSMPALPNRRARRAWLSGNDAQAAHYVGENERRGGFAREYQTSRMQLREGTYFRKFDPDGVYVSMIEQAVLSGGFRRITIHFAARPPIVSAESGVLASRIHDAMHRFTGTFVPYGPTLLELADRFGLTDDETLS